MQVGFADISQNGGQSSFKTYFPRGDYGESYENEYCLSKQPWTIILPVYVGSKVDLTSLTNRNDN